MLLGGILLLSIVAAVAVCLGINAFAGWWWLLWLPLSFLGAALIGIVLALAFLALAAAVVDKEKEQQQDSRFYRTLVHLYIDFALTLCRVKLNTQGLEQAPKQGRFLLVCNHRHEIDPAILMKCFPKSQLAFIAKRETRTMPIAGSVMHKIMCQPINRENDREALKTIIKCIRLIQEDAVSIGVFPEGYIKPDRKLHPFRSGVFKIAQRANVPIVVCTLRGTSEALPKVLKLQPPEVTMHLVGVIPAEELQDATTVQIAEQVYQMMADDLGPELVHMEENA